MTVTNLFNALIKQCLGRREENGGGRETGLSTFIPVGSALSIYLSPIETKGGRTGRQGQGTEQSLTRRDVTLNAVSE